MSSPRHAAWAVALLLAFSRHGSAQHRPAAADTREKTIAIARAVIRDARYASLSTIGLDGSPQARVVDPLEPDENFAVHVATNSLSRKVQEIRRNPHVALLYFDPKRLAYVTLVGRADLVDAAQKKLHSKKDWNAFFDASKPETYLQYRIAVHRIEVVSAKDGLSGDPTTWRPEIVEIPR